jgi:hypothetical protein
VSLYAPYPCYIILYSNWLGDTDDSAKIDEQICEFLDTIISTPHLNPALQKNYVDVLSRMVSLVINGALALDRCTPILGKLDPTRAGICMLRY